MIQVSDIYKIFKMFNILLLFILQDYYTDNIDITIKNDLTSIQSSSTNISIDTFENISKKRKMNESDEANQETNSKVY